MNVKFTAAFWCIVAAQLALLAGMVGFREAAQNAGTEVVLQTVPVDPRSLMQGDYVILRYEIGIPGRAERAQPRLPIVLRQGQEWFVTLEKRGSVWEATRYDDSLQLSGDVAIRGRVGDRGELDFNMGSYFVPEGAGYVVERADDVKVVARVNAGGSAVITGLLVDGKPFEEVLEAALEADRENR